jgi:hypothetical protein
MTRDFFGPKGAARYLFDIACQFGPTPGRGPLSPSLEELTDGKQRMEPEKCFVARLADESLLTRAVQVERHEERVLFLTPPTAELMARQRVRRSTINGEVNDVLTFKVRHKSEQYNKESSVQAPEGLYELFEHLPGVTGNDKTRYVFPADEATGEVWEVDMFPLPEGGWNRWCKIDFEFKGDPNRELPAFPEGLVDIIDTKTTNAEQRQFVDELFKTVFFRDTLAKG